jgi:hypothetical protein
MSDRRLLSFDPLTRTSTYFIPDDNGDDFTIETVQDFKPLIDRNKADMNMVSNSDRWGDGKLVARIPMEIYTDWKVKGYMDDQKKLKQLLDDPDNAFMRTWPGRLS